MVPPSLPPAGLRRLARATALGALLLACTSVPARTAPLAPDEESVPPGQTSLLDSRINVFPIVFYGPETRLGLGVGSWMIDRDREDGSTGKPDNLWLSAVYTQERQTIVQVIPEVYFGQDQYRLQAHLRYLKFPTHFYGIGNDTPREADETYTAETRASRVTLSRTLVSALSAGPVVDYDRTEMLIVEPGRSLDRLTVRGADGSEIAGGGMFVQWDTREQHFAPHAGSLYELTLLRYTDLVGTSYRFTSAKLDLRWYVPFSDAQVLALQALAQGVSEGAPFTSLPRLGGKFLFRGYYEGRYRDQYLAALQAEHRMHFGGRWGGVVFLSFGDVAAEPGAFVLRDFKLAGGAGLRWTYNRPERIHVRLDAAATDESGAVYLSVGEAF